MVIFLMCHEFFFNAAISLQCANLIFNVFLLSLPLYHCLPSFAENNDLCLGAIDAIVDKAIVGWNQWAVYSLEDINKAIDDMPPKFKGLQDQVGKISNVNVLQQQKQET